MTEVVITDHDNPEPRIGQLLYLETRDEDTGEFINASLVFVDEENFGGKQWYHSSIAHMEDFDGEGLEVYTGFEAGGMPRRYTRFATDHDIRKFVQTIVETSDNASEQLDEWAQCILEDEILLPEEKARLLSAIQAVT